MSSYFFDYRIATDTWHIAYYPEDGLPNSQPEEQSFFSDGEVLEDDTWTAFVSPYDVSPNTGIGLIVQLAGGQFLELLAQLDPLPENTESIWFVPFLGTEMTLRVRSEQGNLTFDYSQDEVTWVEVSFIPSVTVSEVGLVLRYENEEAPAAAQAGFARLVPGTWEDAIEQVVMAAPMSAPEPPPPLVGLHTSSEPYVHTIVGAQFGDLEFDVGKCVRWITYFSDNVFILDINLGTQRYWIVNWTQTFPDAKHRVTGVNYFYDPMAFRKEQWRLFCQEFGTPGDDDWVLWIDAHEGLSCDTRSLPDDHSIAPFQSFLWREIQRAKDASQTSVVLPTYVFLRSDNIVNITYDSPVNDIVPGNAPWIVQPMSTPYYALPNPNEAEGLRRLWKASELKKPDFDWAAMDSWATVTDPGVKVQIIDYGYAHYMIPNIPPGETKVPPLTEANDDGWRMRNLMHQIRPVPGLMTSVEGTSWWPPEDDPLGIPGPWAAADPLCPVDVLDPADMTPMIQPVLPNPATLGVLTPLYHTVFRINLRDGVWYEEGVSGNIPLRWDEDAQDWVTQYDPNQWADLGVKSKLPGVAVVT